MHSVTDHSFQLKLQWAKGNGEGWSLHLSHLPQDMDFEFILGRVWINCNLQQVTSLSRCHQVLQLTDLLNCSRKAWLTEYSEIHTGTKTVGPSSQLSILQGSLKTGNNTKVTFIPDKSSILYSLVVSGTALNILHGFTRHHWWGDWMTCSLHFTDVQTDVQCSQVAGSRLHNYWQRQAVNPGGRVLKSLPLTL